MKILHVILALISLFVSCGAQSAQSCDFMLKAAMTDAHEGITHGDPLSKIRLAVLENNPQDIANEAARLKMLYDNGKLPSTYSDAINGLMFDAVASGNTQSIDALVRVGANPNGNHGMDNAPMIAASECGQIPSMQELLKLGADPSRRDPSISQINVPATPLEAALVAHQSQVTTWLLRHHVDTCSAHVRRRLARLIQEPRINKDITGGDMKILQCN